MKRGIKKVRYSIRRRQNKKKYSQSKRLNDHSSLYLPDQEERHGIYDLNLSNNQFYSKKKTLMTGTGIKGIMSLLLFFSFTFILKTDYARLERPQQIVSHYLQEEFPFAKVNDWYVSTFGNPLAFLPEQRDLTGDEELLSLPVSGDVTEPFTFDSEGIYIAPMEDTAVSAFNRGVVIFAGNDRETEKTVIIQHADNSKTTYGYLSSIDVHLYQIVQVNDQIGSFNPSDKGETVYFSIEQNNGFVDPVQVIQVDNSR